MLKFKVDGQELTYIDRGDVIVGGTVRYLEAEFEFSSEWKMFPKITAYFRNGPAICEMDVTGGIIRAEDNLALEAGIWSVYLKASEYGGQENKKIVRQITSSTVKINVLVHGKFEGTAFPMKPTPLCEQWLANMLDAEEAENARRVFEVYDPEKEYVRGNKVAFNGSSYVLIEDSSKGVSPSESGNWLLIASKGEKGDKGEQGSTKNLRDGTAENSLEGVDSEDNPAVSLGKGCISLGDGCVSGCMGYYIQAIDFDNRKIYLTDTKVDGLPTVGAGVVASDFATPVYAVNAEFSIINRLHYPLCGSIVSVENNVVTYEGDLGFTAFEDDTGVDGHVFYVPTQPTVGVVSFVTGAGSIGENVVNVGKCAFGAGRDLLLLEGYGTNFGRRNTTGYGSVALGLDNYVPVQFGIGIGNTNTVPGYAGVALGQFNEVTQPNGVALGNNNTVTSYAGVAVGSHLKVYSAYQNARGRHNIPDAAGKYADIVGNGTSDEESNAYTLDWQGNARYAGKVYAECKNGIGEELATKEQFAQMIGTFEPIRMGTAIKDDMHPMYNELYNTLTTDILKDEDITYVHLEPTSEVINSQSNGLNINRYGDNTLVSLAGIRTIYLKLLLRTNWSEKTRKPIFTLNRILKEDGTLSSLVTGTASDNCVGNGEWETVIMSASVPEGSVSCPQITLYPGGNKNLSASTYPKGTYFDVAAWALFDNAELAESFDMKAAAAGLPGLDFGQRLTLKANKDLSNVSDDAFKQKVIDAFGGNLVTVNEMEKYINETFLGGEW